MARIDVCWEVMYTVCVLYLFNFDGNTGFIPLEKAFRRSIIIVTSDYKSRVAHRELGDIFAGANHSLPNCDSILFLPEKSQV